MRKVRGAIDRILGFLCRRVLALNFRDIEIVGERRIPRGTDRPPLVAVANHVNGLIDPLFVLGPLRLPARLLGKSTLWKIPVLAQILDFAGVLPVHRRQDEGADPAKNLETFARCHEVLARGGTIAIFPEGISHDQPNLQPLRTGAARIVLEAEALFGPLGSRILPIGMHFEERERLRSRVLLVVGEPIDPSAEIELRRSDPVAAARLLTARVSEALERVTLNYATWEQARLVERGAKMLEVDELDLPRARRMGTEFEARRDLLDGVAWLRGEHPAELAAAVEATREYDALLSAAGLTDEQVIASYPPERIAGYLARQVFLACFSLPFALVGTLLYGPPFVLIELIARRVRDEPNQVATWRIFPGLAIYPLWTALLALAAWRGPGWNWAVATVLLAPLCALVAVPFHERLERFLRETRAYLKLRSRRELAEELRRRRLAADRRIRRLAELWDEAQAFDPGLRRT